MKRYIVYFFGILKHKWHVFKGCKETRCPLWLAIIHDWTKFLPVEFFAYARKFYNPDGSKKDIRKKDGSYDPYDAEDEFTRAWINHQRNKHHWQAWCSIGNEGKLRPLPMPLKYVREMVGDWIGAGRQHSGVARPKKWWVDQRYNMVLHEKTKIRIGITLFDWDNRII